MVAPRAREDVSNGAPLERVLGSTTQIKIIDAMSAFKSFDFSVQEIAGNAEISTKSVRRALPDLLRYGIVKEHRRVGRNTMYRYNVGNPITERLTKFIMEIATFDAMIVTEQELAKEEEKNESNTPIVLKPLEKSLLR
jgi:predicted transcriptional regulator